MATIVAVGREGRVTLPAPVRRALDLAEGARLSVEVVDGQVILTPVATLPPRVLEQLERHRVEGKVYRGLSDADLARLGAGEEIDLEPFAVSLEEDEAEGVEAPGRRR